MPPKGASWLTTCQPQSLIETPPEWVRCSRSSRSALSWLKQYSASGRVAFVDVVDGFVHRVVGHDGQQRAEQLFGHHQHVGVRSVRICSGSVRLVAHRRRAAGFDVRALGAGIVQQPVMRWNWRSSTTEV